MESKEINKSESTLTQGTTSKTAFPSNRIFLLSFSLPRDLLHEVFRCTFCTYFFCLDFFAFKSFFAGVFCFLLCLSVFLLKHTCLHHELFRQREQKNFSSEMTTERLLNINYDMLLKFTAMLKKVCCLKRVY
jgi:hypothetical protein